MWPRCCSPFAYGPATATRIGPRSSPEGGWAMPRRLRGRRRCSARRFRRRLLPVGDAGRGRLGRRRSLLGDRRGLLLQTGQGLLGLLPVLRGVELLRLGDELL